MTSFYGCEAFEDVKNGPAGEWWERMRKAVKNHEGRKILELRTAWITKFKRQNSLYRLSVALESILYIVLNDFIVHFQI